LRATPFYVRTVRTRHDFSLCDGSTMIKITSAAAALPLLLFPCCSSPRGDPWHDATS
jgi:hypothetical protein